ERLAGRVRVLPVAGKDIRAAGLNLAVRLPGALVDPELDARQRQAFRAEPALPRHIEREDRRRLREAVSGQHRPAERLEIPGEILVELRAAAAENAEARPYGAVHRSEQQAPDRQAGHSARFAADGEQPTEQPLLRRPPAFTRASMLCH